MSELEERKENREEGEMTVSEGANKSGTASGVIFENFFDGFGSGGGNFFHSGN